MNNMNKKYRCCISAEPDKGSFTKNMTLLKLKLSKGNKWKMKSGSKRRIKCKCSDMRKVCSRKLKDLPGSRMKRKFV